MITVFALYAIQTVGFAATSDGYGTKRQVHEKQEYRLSGEFLGKERCEQAAKELGLTYKCLDTGRTR